MVGRESEIRRLQDSLRSGQSEMIAVYGRRRVGKTFLIRNTYQDHIRFELTGLFKGEKKDQMLAFSKALEVASKRFKKTPPPTEWSEAFDLLKSYLNGLRSKAKKVIFLDEFPWLDTHKSDLLMHLGHFWNTYCEKRKDIVLVVCGSAASYMVQNIVSNRGSLHARLTYKLQIKPFTLYETQRYLAGKNIHWDTYTLLNLYIAIGGIPHYLSKIKKGESAVQNIQRLCFSPNGDMVDEFDEIFKSLFDHSETHQNIIRSLGKHQRGITRDALIAKTKHAGGGTFTHALNELIHSGFVAEYPAFGKKKKMTLFRLCDEYSNFYLKYMEPNKNQGKHFWKTMVQKQSYISWAGFNFETICLKHIHQIKKALKIEGIHSTHSSWTAEGAQIDLVIARDDRWINLCEMKFYSQEYTINASEARSFRSKKERFRSSTKTKHATVFTLISTYGAKENTHFHELIEDSFTMDILFAPSD